MGAGHGRQNPWSQDSCETAIEAIGPDGPYDLWLSVGWSPDSTRSAHL